MIYTKMLNLFMIINNSFTLFIIAYVCTLKFSEKSNFLKKKSLKKHIWRPIVFPIVYRWNFIREVDLLMF